jgi:hypothetical protein
VVSEDLTALAAEAYIYGFPLIFDLREVSRFTRKGLGSTPAAAFNHFSHSPKLAGPGDRFVSINNDTIYSIAQVDVSGGPVLLRVPDAAGASNWLPAPAAPFRPIMRLYQPRAAVLDGSYQIPPMVRR